MASIFTWWTLMVLTLMAHTAEQSPLSHINSANQQDSIATIHPTQSPISHIDSTNQQDSIATIHPTQSPISHRDSTNQQDSNVAIHPTQSPISHINSNQQQDSIAAIHPTDQQLQNGIIHLEYERNTMSAELGLYRESITEIADALKGALLLAKDRKYIEAVSGLFEAIPLVGQTIGVMLNMLSFHMFPSTESIIQKEFKQVNEKLDTITAQLRNMREDISQDIEFHSWMSTYIDWELTIRIGEEKLNTMMSQMRVANDERTKLKIAKSYTDYYVQQDVDGAMKKIFYLTTNTGSVTVSNIFQLYASHKKCDIKGLSMLMITILDITFSASRQMYIHAFLVYNNETLGDQLVQTIYDRLYQTRKGYQELVHSCYKNTIKNAKREIEDILTNDPQVKIQQLTSFIHSKLTQMFPWYDWAVTPYKKLITVDDGVCISLESRGHQVFTVTKDDWKILVMWLDQNDNTHSCTTYNINNARNFIPLTLCYECGFTAGETFLISSSCSADIDSLVMTEASDCGKIVDISFIAGGFKSIKNPCEGKDCSGHGECRSIPDTSNYICICEPFFDGFDCEKSVDPMALLQVAKIINKMRENFGKFIGVPDIVDVYIELREIPKQLETVKDSIMSSIEFRGILSQYGQNLANAEYIAEIYIALLSQEISEKQFIHDIQKLEKLNFDFGLFFWGLKKIVHGGGIAAQEGLLYHYKKSQVVAQPCTQNYNETVHGFMQNILTLDQAVSEAQLRFLYWSLDQSKAPQNYGESKAHIAEVGEAATKRQEGYQQFWKESSCPKLSNDIDLLEKHCGYSSSFLSQTVTPHCLNNKKLEPAGSITCQKINDKLEWSAKPSCIAEKLGAWSSWSTCSQTCGQGTRTRRRTNVYTSQENDPSTGLIIDSSNHEEETDTEQCNIKNCCNPQDGKFLCSNGKCINLSWVCDGDNDCGNNDDDSRSRCNYVRSGDAIALKEHCDNHFLSGNGDWPHSELFMFRPCNCAYERMEGIYARGRQPGDAIRFGDTVLIKFRSDDYFDRWVLPYHGDFRIRSCHKTEKFGCTTALDFKIFAPTRMGGCDGNVFSSCIGKPIQWRDIVFLRNTYYGTYLANKSGWATQRSCPGNTINHYDLTSCACERLKIYSR